MGLALTEWPAQCIDGWSAPERPEPVPGRTLTEDASGKGQKSATQHPKSGAREGSVENVGGVGEDACSAAVPTPDGVCAMGDGRVFCFVITN